MKKQFLFFGAILAALSIFSLISCKTESDDDGYKGFTEVNTGFSGTYLYAGLKNGMVSGGESFAAVNVYDFKTNGRVDYNKSKDSETKDSEGKTKIESDTAIEFSVYTKKDSTLTWAERSETITATIEDENTLKIGDQIYKKITDSSIFSYVFINPNDKSVKYSVYVLNADKTYSLETKIEKMNSSGTGIDTEGSVTENGTYSISGENITLTSSSGTEKTGKISAGVLDLGDKLSGPDDEGKIITIDITYTKQK